MHLLHVINSTDPRGGGPIESIAQANHALARLGHSDEIACVDAPGSPWLANTIVKTHALGPTISKYRYTRRLIPWLASNANRFDAVIVHGLWLFPSLAVSRVLRRSQIPYFVYTHGLLDPAFKRLFAVKHVQKTILWKLFERRVVKNARAVFFTCEEEKRLAGNSFRPFQCTPEIVPYCVASPPGDAGRQRQLFLEKYPECRDKKIVLFLSRIHPKKGCDLLINAFAETCGPDPERILVMAGPDSAGWKPVLQASAARRGIAGKIVWTGMLSGDLKWGAFRAADVFILPSHQENFGIAVVEALSCSLPVLITTKINIRREIVEDEAGLAGDDSMAGALELLAQWLKMSREKRQAMRTNALRCFETRFRSDEAAANLVAVLKKHHVESNRFISRLPTVCTMNHGRDGARPSKNGYTLEDHPAMAGSWPPIEDAKHIRRPEQSAEVAVLRPAPAREAETGPSCPLCGSLVAAAFNGRKWKLKNRDRLFGYGECHDCGILFCFPPPTPEETAEVYSSYYRYDWFLRRRHLKKIQAWHRYRRLRNEFRKNGLKLKRGRMLDVGCGHGWFLAQAIRNGWEGVGVECRADEPNQAATVRSPPVLSGGLQNAELRGPFDLVTMWHALEHMPDPASSLDTVAGLMNDGAYCAVAVPNLDSAAFHRAKGKWGWLQQPFVHVWSFSPRGLRRIVPRCFRIESMSSRDTWDDQAIQYSRAFRIFERIIRILFLLPRGLFRRIRLHYIARLCDTFHFAVRESALLVTYAVYCALKGVLPNARPALRGSEMLLILRKIG